MIRKLLLVLAGGFCGATIRYLLGRPLLSLASGLPGAHSGFPYDILLINLAGAFAIGMLYGAFEQGALISPDVRLALGTGFLGAFTTFSSFMVGSAELLRSGRLLAAALYLVGASVAGVALSLSGVALAGRALTWRKALWLRADAEPATLSSSVLSWDEAPGDELLRDGGWRDTERSRVETPRDDGERLAEGRAR